MVERRFVVGARGGLLQCMSPFVARRRRDADRHASGGHQGYSGHDQKNLSIAPIKCTAQRFLDSHHNPLDLILREPFLGAVIELGGARAFVRGH
jgi:hypothetical protein